MPNMKLALLGVDPPMLSVARAARQRGHSLVTAVEAGAAADFLRELWPQAQLVDDWESLLAPGAVDAVLVAKSSSEEPRADQLRKLIQEGLPLLISHPLAASMLVYYELEMIRRETGCRILPYLPDRWHPAVAQLTNLIQESPPGIGRLEQVSMERFLADRNREAVTRQFSIDIDLARVLAGELTHLSALAPAPPRRVMPTWECSSPGRRRRRCAGRPGLPNLNAARS